MSQHPEPVAAASPEHEDEDACAPPPAIYDPADYRWVPVRRRARLDGWTEEKQRRFIEMLADTGQVGLAAKSVGLTRESAYRLRRQPHAAAFARAWDAARHHAGTFLEDTAFERAIEGVEHNVYNEYGEVICTKRVVSDRLLMFLLSHLKPERYARDALARPAPPLEPVEATLRDLEPHLPAPPEELIAPDQLAHELQIADIADGRVPGYLTEQRPPASAARLAAEERAAREVRAAAAVDRVNSGEGGIDARALADITLSVDGSARFERPSKRYR